MHVLKFEPKTPLLFTKKVNLTTRLKKNQNNIIKTFDVSISTLLSRKCCLCKKKKSKKCC